ncbi:MAG: hypothetical protein AB1801_02440 [Chloroflexota bacterium]
MKISQNYEKWRAKIFNITPEQVGMSKNKADQVYGVIMDMGMIDQRRSVRWAISLSAFPTGEASFQPTPGSGVIGLGNDPKIAQRAREIVKISQELLPETNFTRDFSLPEPGYVQFFFLTAGGVRVIKEQVDKLQHPKNPFMPLLDHFGFIRQFADQILDRNAANAHGKNNIRRVKALYMMAFTPEKLNPKTVQGVTFLAADMLKAKDPTFKQLMAGLAPKTPIEIASLQFVASFYTPQTMQTSMKSWVEKQYNVAFDPIAGSNFFLQGMRDPQGRENYVLFYFDTNSLSGSKFVR